MYQPVRIAPSILSADFMNLARDIHRIEKGGAGFVHVDVMDGHFVPNLTIGVPLVKQLKNLTSIPLDVHLMISNPLVQIPWFIDAGADMLTVHYEALGNLDEVYQALDTIHDADVCAALSIKPDTPAEVLTEFLPLVDMVLVMSVQPGFSGQGFIKGSDSKISLVAKYCSELGFFPLIEVDGGIGPSTAGLVSAAGADVLVCGNAVFKAQDPVSAIEEIVYQAEQARERACSQTFKR